MYVVYGLEDQRKHEIFYVGVTDAIQARYFQHLHSDGSDPLKDLKIREMLNDGYLPLPRTLQLVASAEQAKQRELYWIRHYYELGVVLTNQVIPVIPESLVIIRKGKRSLAYRVPNLSELEGPTTADEPIKETIRRMKASGMSDRNISKAVGLSGRKYGVYREVLRELGYARQAEEA